MIVTKKQQKALLDKYIRENHSGDECIAFAEGIYATLELLSQIDKRKPQANVAGTLPTAAKELADEAWRMLPDACKKTMKAKEFLKTKKVFYGDTGFTAYGEFGEDRVAEAMDEFNQHALNSQPIFDKDLIKYIREKTRDDFDAKGTIYDAKEFIERVESWIGVPELKQDIDQMKKDLEIDEANNEAKA